MQTPLASPRKPFPWVHLAFIAALTWLLSGWTCSALFVSCPGVTQPQIASLSPDSILRGAESTVLTVAGSGFIAESQIMWNGNALPTTFVDSRHLQTTITQQTFDAFGGTVGSDAQISVQSPGMVVGTGCPGGGTSATLSLLIS